MSSQYNVEEIKKKILDWKKNFLLSLPEDKRKAFEKDRIEPFLDLFYHSLNQMSKTQQLKWEDVKPISQKKLFSLDEIKKNNELSDERRKQLLDKLCVLKLNGGLGTSMGCKGPKSLLKVQNEKNFIHMIMDELEYFNKKYGCDIPLVLMNSFNTEKDMEKYLDSFETKIKILSFNQKKNPKLDLETFLPIAKNEDNIKEWNPPGHGDVYDSLVRSGMCDKLLSMGKRYIFLANVDNLGATVEPSVLDYIEKNQIEFALEVTQKTLADVKGGTLIENNGLVQLLEIAQVPEDHVKDFVSIDLFKVFNTNNMWIDLKALKEQIEEIKKIDVIFNKKVVDGKKVIQLEQACGAGVKCFKKSCGLLVPRERFLPVKKCSDLFLLRNKKCFYIDEEKIKKKKDLKLPIVELSGDIEMFETFEECFKNGLPDITELKSLKIKGKVKFGKNVKLIGNVVLTDEKEIGDNEVIKM